MINEGQYDPMEEASDTSLMHFFDGSPTVYRWLLNQEEFFIDLEQRIGELTISVAQAMSTRSNGSKCLEALIAHGSGSDVNLIPQQILPRLNMWLFHCAILGHPLLNDDTIEFPFPDDTIDFPKRIKVLWDAGADIHLPKLHNNLETSLDYLFDVFQVTSISRRTEKSTRSLYDRLDEYSIIKHRLRTSRSLWHTRYPRNKLSILEVAQRYLDAWMEVLLEAGLDVVGYGRREDQTHPGGLVHSPYEERPMEARVYFEYGDHVNGCRIHVTEIWMYENEWDSDPDEKEAASAETSTMPGTWDFDDA